MEVVNKKLVLVVVLIGIISSIFIWQNISDKETKLEMVSLNDETKSSSMFAIMLEEIDEEGNSTYVESTDNIWPSLKYKYNTNNSGCLDVNGTSIPDILSYDAKDQKAIVRTKKVAYCYLYFDIDESVYAKVRNDYTNNNGALLLSETENDEYPVYYYSGNITNNNILYANFCWKMVRTTETGGVKLIYNGVPDEGEDGTLTCDNTGTKTQIGTSAFNSSNNSPAYVGYMYNDVYQIYSKNMWISTDVLDDLYKPSTYYYGDTVTWDGSKYILSNSDGSEVTTYTWSDNYTNLVGMYTCKSSTSNNCATISYVASTSSSYMVYYELSEGKTKDDYKIKLATDVTDNGDGTYTLVNPIEIIKADYAKNPSNYKGYYYCSDLTSETCNDMYRAIATITSAIRGNSLNTYNKYGNSFEYKDGLYTLIDTKEFWDWSTNYNQINNNHYTCFNTSGECTEMNYIHYTSSSMAYYITLKDGKTVETALNEMLYAEDVNTTDSTIKDYIDTWYEGSILNQTDGNGVLYSSYLENTIFCNNRATTNLSASGWNPNGGSTSTYLYFNYNSLECENKTDQFTLKVETGGTEGYGNNALDYPIGLISYKEASLATGTGYLKSGNYYWLLSPRNFYFYGIARVYAVNSSEGLSSDRVNNTNSVRPAVSLSTSLEITSGDGSVTTPYEVTLPN